MSQRKINRVRQMKLGATGEFPEGKLNKDDEGGLRMAITTHKDNVIIDFGKPVHWLGLPKAEATALANMILKKANEL